MKDKRTRYKYQYKYQYKYEDKPVGSVSDNEQLIDEYWNNIQKSIDSIEIDFEKKLTYISAGALALSLTFLDKIVDITKAEFLWIIILGWIFLIITLCVNLSSQLYSKRCCWNVMDDIEKGLDQNKIKINVDRRNKKIEKINIITLLSLCLGIVMIIIFSTINIENRNNTKDNNSSNMKKIIVNSKREIRGNTIPRPPKPKTNIIRSIKD